MKILFITLTVLISVAATGLAEAKPVIKAQSNISAKHDKTYDAFVQNLRG
jgi:hypothetical protein